MAKRELYSDHLDTLIALVQHLAMTKYKSRKPSKLADYLSLDQSEVLLVLENFKGLFRKSREPEKDEYFYTLQLRYARRWLGENEDRTVEDSTSSDESEPRDPLEAGYLSALLGFISNMVEQEQASKRQNRANWATFVAAFVAAVAATIAAIMSYTSSIAGP